MSKFQYYPLKKIIEFLLDEGKEGECWDFKQEWHENTETLIKDIVCFANTVHDENCYIIFGISDELDVVGMTKPRKKQADIIDTISKLQFVGDNYPKISVDTITLRGKEIDVLTVYNNDMTPLYLKKSYGNMNANCIYTRIGDKNTPDKGSAEILEIENLWKKRLGLTKTPLQYIYDRMHNRLEWTDDEYRFYNIYHPEYTIEWDYDEQETRRPDRTEFYCYAMTNEAARYGELRIKCHQTVLKTYAIVNLDSANLLVPLPEWSFIGHDKFGVDSKYSYKYYVLESDTMRVFNFLYDNENGDNRYALQNYRRVVLFYENIDEKAAFECYIEINIDTVSKQIEESTDYDYIDTGDDKTTKVYKERLRTGVVLKKLLEEYRTRNKDAVSNPIVSQSDEAL